MNPTVFAENFAIVTPLANEEETFQLFVSELKKVLDYLDDGTVYFVIDRVSIDSTPLLCRQLSQADDRFKTVWAPENKNVVDAYMAGYKAALKNGHPFIIEMDGGLSHNPHTIFHFLKNLQDGNECAFGARFLSGGSMKNASIKRKVLSRGGTIISNILLGTTLPDMTSGFQGFHASVVEKFVAYPLRSTGHFYQTELRYLLRNKKTSLVPIDYAAPSASISLGSLTNALSTLWFYVRKRISGKPALIT